MILCATLSFAGTKRILLVGDSWAAGWALTRAGDKALAAAGLGEFETEGSVTETALGGTETHQWADNHKGKLDKIREVLLRYPSIDIVHFSIGGNDFLNYARGINLATQSPEQRMERWLAIRRDAQVTVDFILALQPNLRVLSPCSLLRLSISRVLQPFRVVQFHRVSEQRLESLRNRVHSVRA